MTAEELKALRDRLGLTQAEMAGRMGLKLRSLQDIEYGVTPLRQNNALAAERAALAIAVERGDPMLAPAGVRRDALELARMIRG